MTDRRVKEYIIVKDAVAEFVKTVQEWKFQKDWQKKGLIFNPETGISEDGTMHDGVYRPWINKPKKRSKKMTREEAIQIVQKLLKTNRLDGTGLSQVWDFLKQPPTLAEFLNKEEGQEYEWRGDKFRIQSDILQYWDEEEKCWWDSTEELNDYLRLRQARKVEQAKLKAWHVKDEYSWKCLKVELKQQGKRISNIFKDYDPFRPYIVELGLDKGALYKAPRIENPERYDLIEYQKEEPKYFAKIKGWEVFEDDDYYWNYSEDGRYFFIGSKFHTERTKSQWAELGIDEDNAEFEGVE